MLNTKDMSVSSGKVRPLLGPGNNVVRINSITFDQTPYDKEAWNINLHVESSPITGEFEGFFKDKDNESKGRYEGQVGRVRISPFPFKSTVLPSGREINKDQEILKSMILLAETLNKRDALDAIESQTIEQFMNECNNLFSNGEFFNVCLASREWENKEGYTNDDLYLPKLSKDGIPMESCNKSDSRLLKFNPSVHVKTLSKKDSSNGEAHNFEPQTAAISGSDFDL